MKTTVVFLLWLSAIPWLNTIAYAIIDPVPRIGEMRELEMMMEGNEVARGVDFLSIAMICLCAIAVLVITSFLIWTHWRFSVV
jgi:hypothetical protein